jgi:hypothetical protein
MAMSLSTDCANHPLSLTHTLLTPTPPEVWVPILPLAASGLFFLHYSPEQRIFYTNTPLRLLSEIIFDSGRFRLPDTARICV